MMRDFTEYGEELHEFLNSAPKPVRVVKYFAMKNGKIGEFETATAAKAFSPLVEKVVDDADLRAWEMTKAHFVSKQVNAWRAALRAEHVDLSDRQFEALYEYANDKTETYNDHADLMDEIVSIFKV